MQQDVSIPGAGDRKGTRRPNQLVAGLALLAAAAVWGITFPLVKDALDDISPFEFLAIRFTIATLILCAIWPRAAREVFRKNVKAGLIAGALLALGHAFQTIGLERTLSTNAGFITGLYVVFTPLLSALILRRRPPALVSFGVVLTAIGLGLMSLRLTNGVASFNDGDLLVLMCAVIYAGQIIALARYSPESDTRVLTIQQLGVTAIFFALMMPAQPITAPTTSAVWVALLMTTLGSTVFGISVQTWAQAHIPPTRAAVIFSMEAPFAALAAFVLADERLATRAWMGAVLILAGMLIVELRPKTSDTEG
jgi:drug/metabolite transporter (DMT)-like permease